MNVADEKEFSNLDIDKQLWLAKQKELSEYEIIKRKKNRKFYWVWKKILVLLVVVAILIMIYWDKIDQWMQSTLK